MLFSGNIFARASCDTGRKLSITLPTFNISAGDGEGECALLSRGFQDHARAPLVEGGAAEDVWGRSEGALKTPLPPPRAPLPSSTPDTFRVSGGGLAGGTPRHRQPHAVASPEDYWKLWVFLLAPSPS
jgi:hypothetical protein